MKITKEELENIVAEVVSDVYAIDEKLPTELRPADRQVRKKLRQLDPGDPDYPSTMGELRHLIKLIQSSKRSDKVAREIPQAVMDLLPGGVSAFKTINFLRNVYSAPDDKKTNTDLDKLNIDDEVSKIVDDTVEDNFLTHVLSRFKNYDDDDPIPDLNFRLTKYLKKNYKNRTASGHLRRVNMGESIMKITQQELMDIIREELTQIDFDAPPSEEEMRMDKLAGMIEGAAMAKMDDVISMISNHLITTMGKVDDSELVNRALGMLQQLGFKGLKPADAERLISGDEE
jgi:hypothetical protein